jgi:hypothetical protein
MYLQKYVHVQASKDLDTANSYSRQKLDLIDKICTQVSSTLNMYEVSPLRI